MRAYARDPLNIVQGLGLWSASRRRLRCQRSRYVSPASRGISERLSGALGYLRLLLTSQALRWAVSSLTFTADLCVFHWVYSQLNSAD